jgi:hypothetical protein
MEGPAYYDIKDEIVKNLENLHEVTSNNKGSTSKNVVDEFLEIILNGLPTKININSNDNFYTSYTDMWKDAVKDSWKILNGEHFLSKFTYLPLLLTTWMVPEVCRYYQSYLSTMMLLDLIYCRPDKYDFSKACISPSFLNKYELINRLDKWNALPVNNQLKIKNTVIDTYGEEYYYQYLTGQHPMTNLGSSYAKKEAIKGSSNESVIKKVKSELNTSQQKEANIIIDWLTYVVFKKKDDDIDITCPSEDENKKIIKVTVESMNSEEIDLYIKKVIKDRSMYIGQWKEAPSNNEPNSKIGPG